MSDYYLILSGHYDRDKGLDKYLLALVTSKRQVNQWTVTSSHLKGQQKGDQHQRGGLIPPVHHCQNLNKWEVDTLPVDLTYHAGVKGNFYRILPYEVMTKAGTKRGDFGIHFDANAPGSLGCIVMDWRNWQDFEQQINKLRFVEQLERIPLYVFYS